VFYREIGGHNVQLEVADDYDLVVRTYLKARKITKINQLLYLYRYYNGNTHVAKGNKIASETHRIYEANIIPIMLRWSNDKGLHAIDLGSAHNKPAGFSGCDIREAPGVDYVFDLEGEWPFDDSSVGVIRCYDALEHIRTEKKIHFFNEAWRVLAPGGALPARPARCGTD
jgi:SAM-dependent methyltransferase